MLMEKNNKTIGFVFHNTKRNNNDIILSFAKTANERGFSCAAYKDNAKEINFPFLDIEKCRLDYVFALGGDGSVISASSLAAERSVPLLGINNGRIGFLTELEISDFVIALDRITAGDFALDKKMMLKCTVDGDDIITLNDFTVYKKSFAETINLSISVNGIDAGNVFCDGIVVSTPTGATAYSISAGGPIVAPGLECILITPICPHSLCFRPIVASADSVINISMLSDSMLACAGHILLDIDLGKTITITKAAQTCDFMVFKEHNIYSLIREKLT